MLYTMLFSAYIRGAVIGAGVGSAAVCTWRVDGMSASAVHDRLVRYSGAHSVLSVLAMGSADRLYRGVYRPGRPFTMPVMMGSLCAGILPGVWFSAWVLEYSPLAAHGVRTRRASTTETAWNEDVPGT